MLYVVYVDDCRYYLVGISKSTLIYYFVHRVFCHFGGWHSLLHLEFLWTGFLCFTNTSWTIGKALVSICGIFKYTNYKNKCFKRLDEYNTGKKPQVWYAYEKYPCLQYCIYMFVSFFKWPLEIWRYFFNLLIVMICSGAYI